MSEVLQNERQNATFNTKELIDLLNGGAKATLRRKQLGLHQGIFKNLLSIHMKMAW